MKIAQHFHIVILLCVLVLGACSHTLKIEDYKRSGEILRGDECARVSLSLRERAERFQSMRMLARCELIHDDDRYLSRYAFVAKSSGELRIEQLPTTGFYSLAALVSDTKQTTVVVQAEKRAVIAAPGGEAFAELFGLDIPVNEKDAGALIGGVLNADLLNQVMEIRRDGAAPGGAETYGTHFFARVNGAGQIQEVHYFDPREGGEVFSIGYSFDKDALPSKFAITFPRQDAALNCEATQRQINPKIRDDLFRMDIPSDFEFDDLRQ